VLPESFYFLNVGLLSVAYDWKSLKPGSLIVDVGGGIGVPALSLVKAFPTLQFIIQDRPSVVAKGFQVGLCLFERGLHD